jgi:hypothetical protein
MHLLCLPTQGGWTSKTFIKVCLGPVSFVPLRAYYRIVNVFAANKKQVVNPRDAVHLLTNFAVYSILKKFLKEVGINEYKKKIATFAVQRSEFYYIAVIGRRGEEDDKGW